MILHSLFFLFLCHTFIITIICIFILPFGIWHSVSRWPNGQNDRQSEVNYAWNGLKSKRSKSVSSTGNFRSREPLHIIIQTKSDSQMNFKNCQFWNFREIEDLGFQWFAYSEIFSSLLQWSKYLPHCHALILMTDLTKIKRIDKT